MSAGERALHRIAYVLPYLVAGGAERQVLALVRGIDRERYSPIVVALTDGGELEADFRGEGVPVHILARSGASSRKDTGRKTAAGAWVSVRSLYGILRRDRVRILHACLPAANLLGPVAARLAGVPRVIVSKRSLADYKEGHPFLRRVEPLGNRLSDVVLVNSDAVRKDVERTERHWEGKFRKIYNGVAPIPPWLPADREAFRRREGFPADGPLVLCISNFYRYKGHEELVAAAARLIPLFPGVTFLLVGRDSGSLESTRSLAARLGIEGRIRFLGGRTDVPDLLRAADLFVHPSRQEGFSNAILEAMAAALPVVAFDVGGNREAVADGETGILAPPGDAGRLATAMAELLRDPEKRKRMGEAGRRRTVERFSMDRMVREVGELYESLAGGGK